AFGRDVDHHGGALLVEMGEFGLGHAGAFAGSSRARVAAATSRWRISDSPIRKQDAPACFIRARSAAPPRPLSLTSNRPAGTMRASVSVVPRSTINVLRLRLFIPM